MNQAQRILIILGRLSNNSNKESICTSELAAEYHEKEYSSTKDSALRIAQNDMKLIKHFLGKDIVSISRGCYILVNEDFINTIFPYQKDGRSYRKFFEFLLLFDDKILESIASKNQKLYIEKLKKDINQIYSIQADPIENLLNTDIMNMMKRAVKYRRYIHLTIYDDDNLLVCNNNKKEELANVQPHRIVFAQGNWYLAIFDKSVKLNNGFRFLRIGKITHLNITSNTFQKNEDIKKYIDDFQSLFTYFDKENFRVVLKISPDVSKYFINKNFLATQEIVDPKFEDGSLRVHYSINNEMEILPLVKKWLPNIEIISPQWLRNSFYRDLSEMLQKISSY